MFKFQCDEITQQHAKGENDPERCIKIATTESIREMILPGIMVNKFD